MILMQDNITLILSFFDEIGLVYKLQNIPESTFLPGVKIENGSLLIDLNNLLYPGDILHEAGHLACMPKEIRKQMDGNLMNSDLHRGGEMMAIAWSYAVCLYLDIDLAFVFHENGYKGDPQSIIENFNSGYYIGVPLLVWTGMCLHQNEVNGYPKMKNWLCLNRPE